MRKFYALFLIAVFGFAAASQAQVTTNSGSGLAATYTTLASAITALNAATITSPVVITLTGVILRLHLLAQGIILQLQAPLLTQSPFRVITIQLLQVLTLQVVLSMPYLK